MEDIAIGDLFKTPEQKEAEVKEAIEHNSVPESFPSVEIATKWFNERDIFIIQSFRDRSGQVKLDACKVFENGNMQYWIVNIGKKKEDSDVHIAEEAEERVDPDTSML